MSESSLTAARLRALISYDPETGEFVWRYRDRCEFRTNNAFRTWNSRYAGTRAGVDAGHGYRKIAIDDRRHYAHRLAWLYVTGEWPNGLIDHENQSPSDNRLVNLRPATKSTNGANSKQRSNALGVRGVVQLPSGRYFAQIRAKGEHHYLGSFDTIQEASAAYQSASVAAFGEFSSAA